MTLTATPQDGATRVLREFLENAISDFGAKMLEIGAGVSVQCVKLPSAMLATHVGELVQVLAAPPPLQL